MPQRIHATGSDFRTSFVRVTVAPPPFPVPSPSTTPI